MNKGTPIIIEKEDEEANEPPSQQSDQQIEEQFVLTPQTSFPK